MGRALHSRAAFALVGVLAVAAVAGTAAVFGLRASGENDPVLPVATSSYTEAVPGTWQRINPLLASNNPVDRDLDALIFNGLVRIGDDGSVQPDLAESLPDISPDGRTYTFHLRANLAWHDGVAVTSHDVAFTIGLLQAGSFPGDPDLAAPWVEVTVATPDDRTLQLTLPQASSPFLAREATLPILPRHILDGVAPDQLPQSTFNSEPIGTGPYRLTRLTSASASLEANSRYHLGRPSIDRLNLVFYNDFSSALRAVQAGDADGLFARSSRDQGGDLQQLTGMSTFSIVGNAYDVLYLNNSQALFQDDRVRRALSMAIDREEIARSVFGDFAVPSSSPITPGSWAYDSSYDDAAQNLTTAEQLLDDAGWPRHPTTGIRTREGTEFRITIRTDDEPAHVQMASLIARDWDKVGVKATVASTSFTVLRRDFLQSRRYEAALIRWDQGPDPDPYFGWHSSQLGAAGLNLANYANGIADRLIEEGRTSSDPDVRLEMYRQFQEIWNSTMPSIVIAYPGYLYAVSGEFDPVVPGIIDSPEQRFSSIQLWKP